MTTLTPLHGVIIPLVTPFLDGEVDQASIDRMVDHYLGLGVDGFILFGTTGEGPTVSLEERLDVVGKVKARVGGAAPVWVGLGSSATSSIVAEVRRFEDLGPDGYMITVPYYTRPPVDGVVAHFAAACAATAAPVFAYNIPYRTGINVPNEALLAAASSIPNLVGVKDSCGVTKQSTDLLARRPADFAVLTGEDDFFLLSQCAGGDGGILASAHLRTGDFQHVRRLIGIGDLAAARELWHPLLPMIQLLFTEPNPMPLKYALAQLGLIRSAEGRLPMSPVSPALASAWDELVPWLKGS